MLGALLAAPMTAWAATPHITSVTPGTVSTSGGPVTINGSGFTGATAVNIGGASVAFTVQSDTAISATAPGGADHSQPDVSVTTPGGTDTQSFLIVYLPTPSVSGISPSSGSSNGGTTVVISGSGYEAATLTVHFGATDVVASPDNDNQITVTAPAGTPGATVDVTVSTTVGTSSTSAADHYTFVQAPIVTSVSPTSGVAGGGGSVTINGSHFTGATSVTFGGASAAFSVNNDGKITATAPAHAAGTVDILVTIPAGGTSAAVAGDQYTYLGAPTITAVSPTQGPTAGGTSVTITGTNLDTVTGAGGVKFAGVNATSYTVNSPTQITAVSPSGAAGTVDITVTNPSGTSPTGGADQFTFVAPPTVASVSPTSGPTGGGATVIITGTHFDAVAATGGVRFGATAASYTVDSDSQITATTPASAAGTYDVTVTSLGGTSATSAADEYTYVAAPTVSAVSPTAGPTTGGATVTITGSHFSAVPASGGVKFGATTATYTVNSDSQITASAPAGAAGTYDVTVTSPGGTSATSAADRYTYVAAPTVSGVNPAAGPTAGGTSVVINGSHFTGATAVTFGGVAGTNVTVVNDGTITATSPAGTGTVDVTVTTVGGTSAVSAADHFTYVPPPVISGISPTGGPTTGGTSVTITGTHFTSASSVTFGFTAALYTFNSDTSITATAPAGTGVADVRVTTVGGTSATTAADQFTYVPPPTVTGISPNQGPETAGTVVTLTGTNFTGATAVTFGATAATSFTVLSANQISAVTPAGTGTVDVTVTTIGGTSATGAADHFTFVPPPVVGGVSPVSGPSSGGGSVVISGANFTGATQVRFGNQSASFTVDGAGQITATAPANPTGLIDVRVTTVGGISALSGADHYTYLNAPAISSITPATGPTAGGTTVTISGVAFSGASAVSFGGVAATSFAVSGDTTITATAPAGTGTVDVRVTAPGGVSTTLPADQFHYAAPPTVTALSPATGPNAGGTVVTITGTGFKGATAVSFGATPAAGFTVNNAGQITAHAPAGSGTADVTVTTPGGTSATNPGDQFVYRAAPAVTSVSPHFGPLAGGTSVTITGQGFTGATAVRFGTVAATGFTVDSATQITATSPAQTGTVDITVVTPGGTTAATAADQFAYQAAPTVSSLSPKSGPTAGGAVVVIHGTGFDQATGVSFGATPAGAYNVDSPTQITATAPAGAVGSVNVTVSSQVGTSATSPLDLYAYVAGPTVSAVSPASGPVAGGNTVTIQGSGFTAVSGVSFGATAASAFTVNGAGQITATAPAGAVGTVDITVTTAGGASPTSAADRYAYTAGPSVSAVSPAIGPLAGGNSVTITGANLTGATAVHFGVATATGVTVNSATSITVTAPANPAGVTDVTVTTAGGTSTTSAADHYQYVTAPIAGTSAASVAQDSSNNPVTLTLSGGPAASIAVGTGPAHGTLTVTGLNVTYTPTGGYAGADSFTYTATGPGGASGVGQVNLTVTALAPTATTKAVSITAPSGAGGPTTIDLSASVTNASAIIISTPPQHGTVTVNHFVVTYTPTPGYFGTDSFAFEAVQGGLTSAPATVDITLDPPTLTMTPATLPAAQSGVAYSQAVSAAGGTAPYSYQLIGTLPAGLTFNAATATISGTPTGAASASFQIKATDSSTGTGPFSVTQAYTLAVSLGAPTATAKAVTELAGQPVVIHAADGATGGPFTGAAIASPPSSGTTSISGADITFTAPASFSGKVTFTYTLANAAGSSAPATVTVTVNPVPATPAPIVVQVAAGKSGQADVTTGATGGPFTAAAIVSLSPSNAGTASVVQTSASGQTGTFAVRFTPALHFSGPAVVTYTLSNAFATSAPGTVTFQVAARPDPTQDPDVRGLISAQSDAAIRFAQAQLDNINQRLEALHNARGAGNHYGMTFTLGDTAELQSPEDMPWRRSDMLSMQRDANMHGLFGQIPQAYNAAAPTPGLSAGQPASSSSVGGGMGLAGSGSVGSASASSSASSSATGGGDGGGSGAPGNLALWTGGAVDFGLHHTGGGERGLHFTTAGVSVGGDYRVSDKFTFGVAAGYGQDKTNVGSDGTQDRATSYLGAAYASFHPSASSFIDGVVGYGQLHFDTRRYDSVDAETEYGHRTGEEVFASVTAAWQFKGDRTILSPYGKLDVVSGHLDAFTESGGVGALAYGRQSVNSLKTTLGLRGDYLVVTHDGVWAPHFRLEYQHEFDGDGGFDLQYADWLSGPIYHGQLLPLGQNHLVGGVGTDFSGEGMMLSLDYKVDVTTNSDITHQFVVRVMKKF